MAMVACGSMVFMRRRKCRGFNKNVLSVTYSAGVTLAVLRRLRLWLAGWTKAG